MGGGCVVSGCRNKKKYIPGVTYHRFPKDLVRRRKWLFAIHRQNVTEHSRICSAHFSEDMFDRSLQSKVRLKYTAVPKICVKKPTKMKTVTKKVWKPLQSDFFTNDEKMSKNGTIVVRSKIITREAAELFVKEIEKWTNSNFLIDCEMPNRQKVIFHKKWKCQHSYYGKTGSSKLNVDCKASIDILVKKIDKFTRRNDDYLRRREPLPSVIKVNLEHAHKTGNFDSFQALNIALQAMEQFENHFSNGVIAVEAGLLNESKLMATVESGAEKDVAKDLQKSLLPDLIDEQIPKSCVSISDTSYSESESESDVDFILAHESNEADALNKYSGANGITSLFQNDDEVDTSIEYASSEDKRTFLNEIERLMMFSVSKKKLLKLIKCLKSIENECTLNKKLTIVNAIMKRQNTLNRYRQEIVKYSNPAPMLTETDSNKRPLFHYFTVLEDQKKNAPNS